MSHLCLAPASVTDVLPETPSHCVRQGGHRDVFCCRARDVLCRALSSSMGGTPGFPASVVPLAGVVALELEHRRRGEGL